MNDQTAFSLGTLKGNQSELEISPEDRRILGKLAGKVAELASRPIEDEKRRLWYSHNSLGKTRPLVFCDPENGWNEIITNGQMGCTGELARQWEMTLRKEIFWGMSMKDDRVIEPFFNIPYSYSETDWGMHETKTITQDGGSYRWEAPLKDYDDFKMLRFPKIYIDYEQTEKMYSLAKEIMGDFLEVRIKGIWWWTLGMTWTLVNLRGLEQMMYDMYDYPDELHKLMAFLRDGHLVKLDFLEENGLLSLNNDGTYVGSGGFGWTDELPAAGFDGRKIRTADMWGFAESQETVQVSPSMFKEFIFPYQLPILERFGLNCYGCCEALDKRWDMIECIPKLRRVSVSPWADWGSMAEKLADRYIYSMKPHPADLAVPVLDEERIRKSLREAMKLTRDCCVEVIMKDNNTIGNNPENVIRWCRIAQEEASSI